MKNLTNGDITTYCNNIRKYGLDALEGVSLMNAREILSHITIMRADYFMRTVEVGEANPVGQYNYPESIKSGEEWKYWLTKNNSYQDTNYIRFIVLTYLYPEAKEIYPTILRNKFSYEEADELVNAIVTKEITVHQRLVFVGNQFENAIVTYRTHAAKMKFDNLSVIKEPDIKLVGFSIYLHRTEQLRRFTFEMFDTMKPAEKINDLYSVYLNERLKDIQSRNTIIDSHLKTNDLSWLIEQERSTLQLTLDHINLFYAESEQRQVYLEICHDFIDWLKNKTSIEITESSNQPKSPNSITLKSFFNDGNQYNQIILLLGQKSHIHPKTHIWVDDKNANKSLLGSIIKNLHAKGYYKQNKRPTAHQMVLICQNTFGWSVGKSTMEKAPSSSVDTEFIPLASEIQ